MYELIMAQEMQTLKDNEQREEMSIGIKPRRPRTMEPSECNMHVRGMPEEGESKGQEQYFNNYG